jgi:hypothetical protein
MTCHTEHKDIQKFANMYFPCISSVLANEEPSGCCGMSLSFATADGKEREMNQRD